MSSYASTRKSESLILVHCLPFFLGSEDSTARCIYKNIYMYIVRVQRIFLFFTVNIDSFLGDVVIIFRAHIFSLPLNVNYISRRRLNILIKFTLRESDINLHNGWSLNISYFIIFCTLFHFIFHVYWNIKYDGEGRGTRVFL